MRIILLSRIGNLENLLSPSLSHKSNQCGNRFCVFHFINVSINPTVRGFWICQIFSLFYHELSISLLPLFLPFLKTHIGWEKRLETEVSRLNVLQQYCNDILFSNYLRYMSVAVFSPLDAMQLALCLKWGWTRCACRAVWFVGVHPKNNTQKLSCRGAHDRRETQIKLNMLPAGARKHQRSSLMWQF